MSSVLWTPAPTVFDLRSVLAEVYGDTDTGRTRWSLTAPDPIALIHFGEKVRGIVEQFSILGKRIMMTDCGGVYRGSRDDIKSVARAAEAKMFDHIYDSFGWAKTVILDTHNDAWSLSRFAEFGGSKPTGGRVDRNYEDINNRWRQMLVAARQSGKNVILIGMTADEWIASQSGGQDKKSGRTVRATHYSPLPIKVDVTVRTYSQLKQGGGKSFLSVIEKPWMNAAAGGMILTDDMSNFPTTMSLITGTSAEEWK